MNTPGVKAIDGRSVHQICSGQVVVTLSTAVKELVENSLDAGASNVEIRLKNFGADSLEVVDNGSGVLPENFHALALKHHTSKLNLFSDLAGVETFGFRGEALSSLCALSDLSITTCHISKNIGARIEYDHDGNITNQTAIARVSGTTVTLQNLFSTLPVRHKEFLRNLKREYTKLVQVLQSYCVICSGVRLSCYTHSEKGKKNLVLSTNGNPDMRENISNVFGPKQLQTLLEFKQVAPTKEDCEEQGLDISRLDDDPVFNLTGFVSRCDHRAGRSTTDRQYIFINKRPCDLPKVVRLVNEAYHAFNRNQYPFLALHISLSKELVDVNVTPDKRQVFLQQEKLLLATIRTSLKCLFDPDVSSYALNEQPFDHVKLGVSNLKGASISSFSKSIKDRLLLASESSRKKFGSILDYANRKERNAIVENDVLHNEDDLKYDSDQNCNSVKENVGEVNANTEDVNGENENYQNANYEKANEENTPCKCVNDDNTIGLEANCKNANGENADGENAYTENADSEKANGDDRNSFNRNRDNGNSLLMNHSAGTTEDTDPNDPFRRVQGKIEELPDFFERIGSVEDQCTPEHTDIKNRYRYKRRAKELKRKLEASEEDRLNREGREPCGNVKKIKLEEEYGNLVDTTNRKSITVEFNWKKLLMQCAKRDQKQIGHVTRTFRATIAPENNQKAEDELRRHITKEMFGQMEIIGQFNQGFIVSKLKDDLFIIDQHASDEKYNFEEQQKNTIIKSQRLISPQELDLTAVNESILIENIEVFQKNGFGVEIDEEAPVSKRVKLVSLPVSRNWSFGKSDIDELIFMLSDSPGVCYRPSNVRKMFASRACRMSIMVGTALNTTQMRRIVGHMGEMEHPWNCPHGRPTMRHLINLNMIRK